MNFHHHHHHADNNNNNNKKSRLFHPNFPSGHLVLLVPEANVYKAKRILFLPKVAPPALFSISEMVLLHSGHPLTKSERCFNNQKVNWLIYIS